MLLAINKSYNTLFLSVVYEKMYHFLAFHNYVQSKKLLFTSTNYIFICMHFRYNIFPVTYWLVWFFECNIPSVITQFYYNTIVMQLLVINFSPHKRYEFNNYINEEDPSTSMVPACLVICFKFVSFYLCPTTNCLTDNIRTQQTKAIKQKQSFI